MAPAGCNALLNAWVCAWVHNLNLNSPEKNNAEIKSYLKDKGYNPQRSLKYGILADTSRLGDDWGISEVLAGLLSDEAQLIAIKGPAAVAAPVFTAPSVMTQSHILSAIERIACI